MTAADLVTILIEADDVDSPEGMLDRNRDLAIRAAFLRHGWVIRSNGDYGKMAYDGDVRYIVQIEEHPPGSYTAYLGGENLQNDRHRTWEPFDISTTIALGQDQTEDDFVTDIEDSLAGHGVPESDPEAEAHNEYLIRGDERRDLDQDR